MSSADNNEAVGDDSHGEDGEVDDLGRSGKVASIQS